MQPGAWIIERLREPKTRRWLVSATGVGVLHAVVLALLAPAARTTSSLADADQRIVPPIYLTITPRARPARQPAVTDDATSAERASDQPPVAVRQALSPAVASDVAPFVVDTPPPGVRPAAPGRVIPQSWRDRCGLGDGAVTDAALRACREGFLQAATPTAPRPEPSDPRDGWAAIAARNHARYDYFRSPADTGSGNAPTSATPGSNFGWGDMDRSVIYTEGSRPEVNGGID
jgi:hypothetical protein